MKVLRIKLTNLNSLRGTHEVDFQAPPLAGVGLFAITGSTGAGKSTLLDAITLALYGKAARYGAAPSPEDMMSRHCGECAAEVEFQVPSGTYRAEWQLHRARGNASGKVQAAKRYVYDAAGQPMAQNVRDTEELIQKLIGLDYDRFLRSALLAQGDFAQFLKARPDERAALLETLTGTSIYSELGTLAHTETVRRENELRLKEAGIQNIQLLEEKQRARLALDIPAAETTFTQVEQDLQRANDLLNKAVNLATALEQEQKALEKQQALIAERQTVEQDLERLSRHRLTFPFQEDLAKLDAAEKTVGTARSLLAQAQRDHTSVVRNAKACLRGLHRMIARQIEATKSEIENYKQQLLAADARKTVAETWLTQHKSDKDLPVGLADLISDLASLKGARKDLGREWGQIRKFVAKLDQKEADELPLSPDDLGKTRAKSILRRQVEVAEKKLETAGTAKQNADAQLEARENYLKNARFVASFEEQRGGLKKGEPCPLCGAKEHPFTRGAEPSFPFDDLERQVTQAKEACRTRERDRDRLVQLRDDLQATSENLLSAVDECGTVLARLAKNLKVFGLPVPPAGTEDEAKAKIQQRAVAYSQHATEAGNSERDHGDINGQLGRSNLGLAVLNDKHLALARESITELGTESEPDEVSPHWSSLTAAESDWSTVKSNLAAANATLGNRQNDNERAETQLSDLVSGLAANLTGSAFNGIDNLKAARLGKTEATRIETVEKNLKERDEMIHANLRAAREAIERWRTEVAPESEAVPELKARQRTLQNQHDQLIRDLTTWKSQLGRDETNRRVIAETRKELEADQQRLNVWQRLRGLIGSHDGRTFRRYAQSVSLDVLVHFANRQLLRLNDRYQLRRREGNDLDLEIEDLHQAGAVRPMASLSGGESFLASLALALGLSDIAGRKVRIESLFIDEGFGSLDSDTLDLAISALETLRQNNKTVGVISHVDLLKERIATQIIVEKQSGGTSLLRISS